jgi:hypothetical protein
MKEIVEQSLSLYFKKMREPQFTELSLSQDIDTVKK